ncbi:TnsD family Tn7-like transposition protein [Paraburkholderia youngii]|uniref:TniQ domain-containing protein n=1 Tax=Paraburkholderia youngii TaxID=2782701 RepID=A0A7Y6JUE6_9BURK|nr:TnsD family Tn7-like transposition protein [Paraburkholderia youngii]NUX98896.1 hypothetical protein [Paraburkholderia youngii]NVI08601.1 hypothetical protein [Paraburkholderia youngii]
MPVYLDEPLPDEMLFSVIARYVQGSRVGDIAGFLRNLMGVRGTVCADGYLDLVHLATQTEAAWGMTPRAIQDRLTHFPFYSAMVGPGGNGSLGRSLLRCAQWSGYLEAGYPGLRFCRTCWRQDDERQEPRYWRRSHQLPGVVTCVWHGEVLHVAGAPAARRLLVATTRLDEGHPAIEGRAGDAVAWRDITLLAAQLLGGNFPWTGFFDPDVRFGCARRCGYASGNSLDFARMSRDMVARLGNTYMRAVGLAGDGSAWLRRAFLRPTYGSFQSLPLLLVAHHLIGGSSRPADASTPICPGARSDHDEEHRVTQRRRENGCPHYFCSCGFSFIFEQLAGGDGAITPTQTGPDIAMAAAVLASRSHSVAQIASSLGLEVAHVERQIGHRVEVRPWHRRTVRARHLASWVELVNQLGDANAAFLKDGRLWRRVAPLAEALPEALLPALAE